ncbi:hypothetical protein ACLBWX_18395 [Methylobacterium sp. M6A4_1b]
MMDLNSRGAPDPAIMGPRPLKRLPKHLSWIRTYAPQSVSSRELAGDYDLGPLPLRSTPPGEPKVPDILKPGTVVRSNYSDRLYFVLKVDGPFFYHPPEQAAAYEEWSLHLVTPEEWSAGRKEASAWINEIVAVGGRLLKLFANNSDEVFLTETAAPACQKPVQMRLFA